MADTVTLTPAQQQAFDAIKKFLKSKDQIFILKGSAGTGKTTLVHAICKYLKEKKTKFQLAATTGRAAKVLSTKAGANAITLRSMMYIFDEVAGRDDSGADPWESEKGQLFLNFGLRSSASSDTHPKVIIIDEASMISHLPAENGHTATFGSGRLLDDLLQFAAGSKLIFVGDPCQLPPVAKESFSAALSQKYWINYGKIAHEFELTEIVRHQQHNEILQIAERFRQVIIYPPLPPQKNIISFPYPQGRNVFTVLGNEALLNDYVQTCKKNEIAEAVTICATNNDCYQLNNFIRKQLHGQHELQTGELLMVVQNSYSVDLVNGDQVIVEQVAADETRAGFTFLKVKVRSLFTNQVFETKMIRDLLYNAQPGLTPDETKRLLIDFDKRMRNRGIGRNSQEYKERMKADPFLNALRAKFGYAITVHKAQGGEWNTVYLYLTRSLYAPTFTTDGADKYHRWFYTAITRAKEKLLINDCPTIEKFAVRHPQENARYWQKVQAERNVSRKSPVLRTKGVVTRILNRNERGVNGFIKPDGSDQSVYFSLDVKNPLHNRIDVEQQVSFDLLPAKEGKGPKAIHIKIEHP